MTLLKPFLWTQYGRGLEKILGEPKAIGSIAKEMAVKGELRRVIGESGQIAEGSFGRIYLLVDESDGTIIDAKFQAFGETPLIGALEILCALVLHKNYLQAGRITAELIEKEAEGFPKEAFGYINLALDVLEDALVQCKDIVLEESFYETPVDLSHLQTGEYPDWAALSNDERLATLHAVIETEIKPYVELDDGGVEVAAIEKDTNVFIRYAGNCTTCYSATSSTLGAIQQILRAKVHPEIVVTPLL